MSDKLNPLRRQNLCRQLCERVNGKTSDQVLKTFSKLSAFRSSTKNKFLGQ
jgi:hypothetical protein